MDGLDGHLQRLINSDEESPQPHRLQAWLSHLPALENLDQSQDDIGSTQIEDASFATVIDVYTATAAYPQSDILRAILAKHDGPTLLDSMYALLSSTQREDELSGQLTDLLGYDDIELVFSIIPERKSLLSEIEAWRSQPSSSADGLDFSTSSAKQRIEETLRENAARPLFTGIAGPDAEVFTHVYTSSMMSQGNVLSHLGTKYMLPVGTERVILEEYEEVTLPPATTVPPRAHERLIPITELDDLGQGSFPGYSSLNRIQSIVFPTAYGSNENLLICAPTGAGKTDVAMMSILRVLDQHRTKNGSNIASNIQRDTFKIIYVAPMKALVAEIVRKLGKRLKWLSIQVRELTGDMQLTKAEISQTQIIVTTPEKWDVVTRKPTGEGELSSLLKLLIIDEVHLLNEERGAVIETIVARTLRQVESSQSIIRIVGLSATLPNYVDVAEFLSVNKQKGMFYFDSSFRPVPLEQHFIGVKGKPGSPISRKNLDHVTFEKVAELVQQGHQVMVFVHSRKETVKAAQALQETAAKEGITDAFLCEDHPQYAFLRRDVGQSRNKEMKQLFDHGFGIHHAGMSRSDRNMTERLFEARAIKVLCCTATLAWGVNLPAHAVIIKGTQVYDSSKGAFTDLSVLDVLQVFGRAGRPGLETSGEGYICTTEDKLQHYLDAVTSQIPIESQFRRGMIDALNAEISLGTVANVRDAMQWLSYTYLFVRMRKNPYLYGIIRDAAADDPQMMEKRNELIVLTAKQLADSRMIIFDQLTGAFSITDLGRIAARYYIQHKSIEIFNKEFRPNMTEADVLGVVSISTEFEQVQLRDSEQAELEAMKELIPCEVKDGHETSRGKVNILLQGYISRQYVEDFALVSDMGYIAQNAGRIFRALMEIAISRKWAHVSAVLMGMSKAIEQRLWPFDQPMKQFPLKQDVIYALETYADDYAPADLVQMSAGDLGKLIHLNEIHGRALLAAAKQFPTVRIEYDLRPLGSDVLKIAVHVHREFDWNAKVHGSSQPFWLWVEDSEGIKILQLAQLLLRESTNCMDVDFVISIPNSIPPKSVTIRFVSDRWMGAEEEVKVPLESLIMPLSSSSHTPLIDLPFLAASSLRNPTVEAIIGDRLHNFNSMQTQVFWSLLNTKAHSLLCAPTGSGKTMMIEALIWSTVLSHNGSIFVVAPKATIVLEIASQLRIGTSMTGIPVEIAKSNPFSYDKKQKRIIVVAAEVLFNALSKRTTKAPAAGISLVVCENLEHLDSPYEMAVSLLRHATQTTSTRFVGASSSLNDPGDLAAWLGVDPFALHSFRPKDRGQSLTSHVQTFNIPQSASLFKAMTKPAHTAIMGGDSALVFVASRALCRSVAQDLLTQRALERETESGYLPEGMSDGIVDVLRARLRDRTLLDLVSRGIGIYHAGILKEDRNLMLDLYAEGVVRVLLVPHDSCWTIPVRASVVVVMGTQYLHVSQGAGFEGRQLRDYDLVNLVRMQGRAIRHTGSGAFHLFCQVEARETLLRFLSEGLPLESKLLEGEALGSWYRARKETGALSPQDITDILTFTFLGQRVSTNPAYYDCKSESRAENLSRIVDSVIAKENVVAAT
ncbi:Sec63-domain-containing protein [Cylindrobasidium torrendii FP15055 ss-10]|uniref:Sec63-domain-containing protein n=1 Tax=Cylindrobasidium torrendii FP15055 ss-10 TaxID=1314674 RepID=A0A0D7BT97_9AGAR|nr:Sec63-domain-containing protein [Cylindrobasidium torrendii FP15055 ss-10]